MSSTGAIPALAAESIATASNMVPPIYRQWSRERIQTYLARPGSNARLLRHAASKGGGALGAWMLSRSSLPDLPQLRADTLEKPRLLVADTAGRTDRQDVASVAKTLLRTGLMDVHDIERLGENPYPSSMTAAICRALTRHIAKVSRSALSLSPFTDCEWTPFAVEMTPHIEDTGADSLLCATISIGFGPIYAQMPRSDSKLLLDAFRIATSELGDASRYSLFAGPDQMFEAVFPYWYELCEDLMVGIQWDGNDPIFDRDAYRRYAEDWFGNAEAEPGTQPDAEAIDMARYMRDRSKRYPGTKGTRKKLRASLAEAEGKSADLIRNLFRVGDALQKRKPVCHSGVEISSDATYPTTFVVDADLSDSLIMDYLMEGFGTEGVSAHISASAQYTEQFVRVLEDVVLEASLISDAVSAIAFHE